MEVTHLKNKRSWQVLALIIIDAVWFGSTNAATVASPLVMISFGLLTLTIYFAIYGLVNLVGLYGIRIKRKSRLSLYITGALALLVALQSVGELGQRDMLLLAPLALLGYMYSAYSKNQRTS